MREALCVVGAAANAFRPTGAVSASFLTARRCKPPKHRAGPWMEIATLSAALATRWTMSPRTLGPRIGAPHNITGSLS